MISPPSGAFVARVMPASAIALALARTAWPSARSRTTGLSGETARERLVGGEAADGARRRRVPLALVPAAAADPLARAGAPSPPSPPARPPRRSCACPRGPRRAGRSRSRGGGRGSRRSRGRRCGPARSRTRVFGPTRARTSAFVPTATMRLPRTATASARGRFASTVCTTAFVRTRSAGSAARPRAGRPAAGRGRGEARATADDGSSGSSSDGRRASISAVRGRARRRAGRVRHVPLRRLQRRGVAFGPAAGDRAVAARPRRPPRKVRGPFTRETLREAILGALVDATRAGRRVLFGIDHQWSWPRDLWGAAGLAGRPWRAALRSLVHGEGGRPPLGPAARLPRRVQRLGRGRRSSTAACGGSPARTACRPRATGRATRFASPSGDAGGEAGHSTRRDRGPWPARRSSASSSSTGCSRRRAASASPFSPGRWTRSPTTGRSHVGCEIYPSFCRPPHVRKTDDADARWTCLWASRADLATALDLTPGAGARCGGRRALEGWILRRAGLDTRTRRS